MATPIGQNPDGSYIYSTATPLDTPPSVPLDPVPGNQTEPLGSQANPYPYSIPNSNSGDTTGSGWGLFNFGLGTGAATKVNADTSASDLPPGALSLGQLAAQGGASVDATAIGNPSSSLSGAVATSAQSAGQNFLRQLPSAPQLLTVLALVVGVGLLGYFVVRSAGEGIGGRIAGAA